MKGSTVIIWLLILGAIAFAAYRFGPKLYMKYMATKTVATEVQKES